MYRTLPRFIADEQGAAAIEYALVASLVSVALIATLILVGVGLSDQVASVVEAIQTAGS